MRITRMSPVEVCITSNGWANYEIWSRIQCNHALTCVIAGVLIGVIGLYGTIVLLCATDMIGVVPLPGTNIFVFPMPGINVFVFGGVAAIFFAATWVAWNSFITLWQAPVYVDGRCEALSPPPNTMPQEGETDDNEASDDDPDVAIARAVAA